MNDTHLATSLPTSYDGEGDGRRRLRQFESRHDRQVDFPGRGDKVQGTRKQAKSSLTGNDMLMAVNSIYILTAAP